MLKKANVEDVLSIAKLASFMWHSPVGYLEGIFIKDDFRHRGYATELLAKCEMWAKEQGCAEFASDCELDNKESLFFHLNSGFEEANRIICFTKRL